MIMQHNNIILSADGAAPSPATWLINHAQFLADRTNGRAYATVLRPSVCLSVVVVCSVM